jgi:hypothetical protein
MDKDDELTQELPYKSDIVSDRASRRDVSCHMSRRPQVSKVGSRAYSDVFQVTLNERYK